MFGLEGRSAVYLDIGIVAILTIIAGCVSGLTLSLFSLDENYLNAVAKGPNHKLASRARRVLILVNNPHWLLITMLVMNAGAVEAMPIILDEILNPIAAVAISVTLVLIFGEIIPQALFIRHALLCGSIFYLPLRFLMILTSPISYTVGMLLDRLVGHREAVFFRRQELRAFIKLYAEMKQDQSSDSEEEMTSGNVLPNNDEREEEEEEKMTAQEIKIMLGALNLTDHAVSAVLKTKLDEIVCLKMDTVLTKDVVDRLFRSGFSRIPVYDKEPSDMSQYLITKRLIPLIFKLESDAPLVKDLTMRSPSYCSLSTPLIEVYHMFQKNGCHMFFVTKDGDGDAKSNEVVGLLTSHDVFEVMHQTSFRDEMDLRASAPVQMIMRSWQNVHSKKVVTIGGHEPVSAHGTHRGLNARKRFATPQSAGAPIHAASFSYNIAEYPRRH